MQERELPGALFALYGSKEIGFTIVSMTISLVAVFIPALFRGGILGRRLRELAIVIMVFPQPETRGLRRACPT